MKYLSILTKLMAVALVISFIPIQPAKAFEQLPRSLRWELIDQSGEIQFNSAGYPYGIHHVKAGETVSMWILVKNHSTNPRGQVWYGKSALLSEGPNYPNAHAIGVGTWDPVDHIPSFLDSSSFVINNNRLAYYDDIPVNQGGTMWLQWEAKVRDDTPAGTYDLVLSLVREFDEWGYRTTASGGNHKYRGILWRFIVGDQYDLKTVGDISVGYTTWDGKQTIYFKEHYGGVGFPMTQEQATQIHRGLREKLGMASSWIEEDMSAQPFNFIISSPLENGEIIFSTAEYSHEELFDNPDFVATSRIYAYNTQTQNLRKIYEYASMESGDPVEQLLYPIGITGNKLILYLHPVESSPGPCWSPWLNNVPKFTLDLSQSSPTLVSGWYSPQWKIDELTSEMEDFCVN